MEGELLVIIFDRVVNTNKLEIWNIGLSVIVFKVLLPMFRRNLLHNIRDDTVELHFIFIRKETVDFVR